MCTIKLTARKKMRKKNICRVFNLYIFMVLMAIIYKENQSGIVVNKKNWIFQIFPLSKEYFRLREPSQITFAFFGI